MSNDYEEWGRQHWEEEIEGAGFEGDPNALWDAMIAARKQCWTSLGAPQIAEDHQKLREFFAVVRQLFGGKVSEKVITRALLSMPRNCRYCEYKCWEWCDFCGGCPTCCDYEIHCVHCALPQAICCCPDCKCLWPKDNSN